MILAANLSGLKRLYTGKVRDVYAIDDDRLLLVTSNRVSAFDVVFPEPIPSKGAVLNLLSAWWFGQTADIAPNHLVETRVASIFADGGTMHDELRGRCALVRRVEPIRFECVVRGHLDGSAWKEYERTGGVCGHRLPPGLRRYDPLPRPIFTPATKAETGHDENVTVAYMADALGAELTERLQALSIALYERARAMAATRGLLLLDTKFEFGFAPGGELLLIDEIFTPDSSRYRASGNDTEQARALDKQFLRDWLVARGWTGDGPPPPLPAEIVAELGRRYERAFELITGETLSKALEERG